MSGGYGSRVAPSANAPRRFPAIPHGSIPPPTPPPPGVEDVYGNPEPEWLGIDWRAHQRTVEVEGSAVNLVEYGEGEGDPLLLVHGLGGCWQNFLENIPALGRHRRIVAPDLPGFGHSPMPSWQIGISAYGRHLTALCEALGIERCTVIGNSMGGFVGAELAHSAPHQVAKLVLIAPAGYWHAHAPRLPMITLARLLSRSVQRSGQTGVAGFRRPRGRWASFRAIVHAPHLLRPELLWEFAVNGMGRPGFLDAMTGIFGYDFHDRLADVIAPTLFVWGRNDRIVPAWDAEGYVSLIPRSRLEVFDCTGHVPMAERPRRFNATVERFLAEPDARAQAPAAATR